MAASVWADAYGGSFNVLKHVAAVGGRSVPRSSHSMVKVALLLPAVAHEVGKACGRRTCRARAEEEQLASLLRRHGTHLGPKPLDLIGARRVAAAVLSRGLTT